MLTSSQNLKLWRVGVWAILALSWGSAELVWGQAGLREALQKLDRDGDGDVEPHEITPQARPFLERIARGRRLSLDRDNRIEEWQEAARIYFAMQNGASDESIQVQANSTIRGFGTEEDQPLIPEFGLSEVMFPYTTEDVEDAERMLRRYDENNDGFVDRQEAKDGQWSRVDPFEMDFNRDDRLSRMEMIQRYARRRQLSEDAEELIQRVRRVGSGVRPVETSSRSSRDEYSWWRNGSSHWLSASMLSRFDLNRNGRLEAAEYKSLGLPVAQIDIDRDGELSREELHNHVSQLQEAAGDESAGLPGWFYELDADDDRQVSMVEFSQDWSPLKLLEFESLDVNGDGLLTASEVAQSKAVMGGSYENLSAEVIPPRKTIISEIEIEEDVLIGDLNVQLSITHTNTSSLDGFLTSPSGQRVELFGEVGGSGDHFDQTIFDDQADTPINKAQAPFRGTYHTLARVKRQPGLEQFNGQSARGVWQLVIRGTRGDRFGMLHGWSIIIQPREAEQATAGTAAPAESVQPPEAAQPAEAAQQRSLSGGPR